MHKIVILSLMATLLLSTSALAQRGTVFGQWITIDDHTGKARSVVEVYEQGGKLFGKVVRFFPRHDEDADPLCKKCKGENKDKKILGMVIINGLTKSGAKWSGAKILDPDNGKFYNCKLWLEKGKLIIRGYLLFFYRTQIWLPYSEMMGKKATEQAFD